MSINTGIKNNAELALTCIPKLAIEVPWELTLAVWVVLVALCD